MILNWVDWIIIAFLTYELYIGWKLGFVHLGINFIAFASSLWIAVLYNVPVSYFFSEKFGIATPWNSVLSYVALTFAGQMIFSYILNFLLSRLPAKIEKSIINSVLGALVSGVNTLTTIAFIILIILALPLKGTVQTDIRSSEIGSRILSFMDAYGGPIKTTANEIKKTAAKFLTVSSGSTSSMPLDITVKSGDMLVDDQKERAMVELINKERVAVGLKPLTVDIKIVAVARSYSKDMFIRKYFSHISPEGKNVGDRLTIGEVKYSLAGENIAYAPDLDTAHQGLMNSVDHKKNILDSEFQHIGVGIISTSKFGIMVTQVFTN